MKMCSKELLLLACLLLLGGLRLTSTTTTTTFVAAMSIANQDLDRYFRTANATQTLATEDRILIDFYNYAFLNYTYRNEYGLEERVSFPEEKARYGEGLVTNREGPLVHVSAVGNVSDDTACSPQILGTNGTGFPHRSWIALVRRGRCTFEEKVKHVHDHGAMAVIIYNDKQVNTLEKMQIKDQKRDITAVITYLDIGLQMARIVDLGMEMEVAITLGRSGSRPLNSLNKTSVLFVSISFIVLMVISLVWLLFYYIQRFRYLQTKDQQSRQLCSVTKKAIMKIPTKTGKSSDDKDMDSDCCAICIEAYKPSDCIRVLPCKHEFHKNCIDPWLIEHRTCPMCKLDVLKFYGFVVGDQIHTTPSPQHIPPNIATLGGGGENDVEVIVVALAPPFSAAQQSSQTRQQQYHQTQSTNAAGGAASSAVERQQQQMQTQLPPATAAVVAVAHAQHQHTQQQQTHTHTCTHHCNCASSGSSHSYCNCSNQMQGDSNCCNQQQQQQCNSCNSCQHGCGHTRSGNTNIAAAAATNIVRRNSAPLVLQVSTASHQVTDV